ncbi:MAG TPA: NAD(P)H-dependent oxidoreductase subunit E [Acidimicrobiales bacterium]|nr:NAD(P)H-dependent oxidoreductase subunit E [Acidimicrobiales bacterium]
MAKLDQDAPVFSEDRVKALIETRRNQRGPLLEVLHALAEEFGYIDERAIPIVARALNLSRAEVHGVATFYRDFRSAPPPASVVRLCRAEACQALGAERLVGHARDRLGIGLGEHTADNRLGLEQVFCLGNCALGPSALVDGRLVGRLSEEGLDAIFDAATKDAR